VFRATIMRYLGILACQVVYLPPRGTRALGHCFEVVGVANGGAGTVAGARMECGQTNAGRRLHNLALDTLSPATSHASDCAPILAVGVGGCHRILGASTNRTMVAHVGLCGAFGGGISEV